LVQAIFHRPSTSASWRRQQSLAPHCDHGILTKLAYVTIHGFADEQISGKQDPSHRGCCACRRPAATDPRDKIYGVLGISNSDFSTDYAKSVREVYNDFSKCWLNHDDSSWHLFTYAGVGRLGSYENPHNLPSWTPDWQTISQYRHDHAQSFNVPDGPLRNPTNALRDDSLFGRSITVGKVSYDSMESYSMRSILSENGEETKVFLPSTWTSIER
jgi:hypothetical protein